MEAQICYLQHNIIINGDTATAIIKANMPVFRASFLFCSFQNTYAIFINIVGMKINPTINNTRPNPSRHLREG